jgi:hypothetical protein
MTSANSTPATLQRRRYIAIHLCAIEVERLAGYTSHWRRRASLDPLNP